MLKYVTSQIRVFLSGILLKEGLRKEKYVLLITIISSDKVFKSTIVNQTLHFMNGGSLEIKTTVPLNVYKNMLISTQSCQTN